MRVAFFSNFHQPCGIADYSTQLSEELSSMVELQVVSSPLLPLKNYSYSSYLHYANRFRQCAQLLNKADICHIQHEYSFWGGFRPLRNLFPLFSSAITVPVVMTAHEILDPPFKMADFKGGLKLLSLCLSPFSDRYSAYVNAGMFGRADCTIVHTRQQKEMLVERGLSPAKVIVISHGVAPCHIPACDPGEVIRRFGLEGKRLITITGFITYRKGYDLVLDILTSLPDDVCFVIAGGCRTESDETYAKGLLAVIGRAGLAQRVVITGYLEPDELHAVVRASSIVLAPFRAVAGSGSLSIAFAQGMPVIASNLAPLVELNESSRSMLLFEADNSADLLEKVRLLLSCEHLSAELSAAALQYAARNSMRSVAELTVALYERVLINRSQDHINRR